MLRRGAAEVHTVEHLLAALLGLQLDDLEIELNGPELPSLDGSALPWFEALQRAGAAELKAPRKTLELQRPVSVELEGATLTAMPSERAGLHLSYTLDYSGHGLPPLAACAAGGCPKAVARVSPMTEQGVHEGGPGRHHEAVARWARPW